MLPTWGSPGVLLGLAQVDVRWIPRGEYETDKKREISCLF
jgi:hypothetical protein